MTLTKLWPVPPGRRSADEHYRHEGKRTEDYQSCENRNCALSRPGAEERFRSANTARSTITRLRDHWNSCGDQVGKGARPPRHGRWHRAMDTAPARRRSSFFPPPPKVRRVVLGDSARVRRSVSKGSSAARLKLRADAKRRQIAVVARLCSAPCMLGFRRIEATTRRPAFRGIAVTDAGRGDEPTLGVGERTEHLPEIAGLRNVIGVELGDEIVRA